MRSLVCGSVLATVALAACGGRVVVDGFSGEGGAGGTYGVSSAAQVTSGTFSSAYAAVSAVAVATVSSSGSGGGILCGNNPFPGIGAPCNLPPGECDVPLGCCKAKAHCKLGFWSINTLNCQPDDCAVDCIPGMLNLDLDCVAGAVCVVHTNNVVSYQCRLNPCAGPLDCSCAEPYCAEQGMTCAGVENGSKVYCK